MHQHGLTLIKDEQKKGLHLEIKRFFYPNLVDDQKKSLLLKLGRFFVQGDKKKGLHLKSLPFSCPYSVEDQIERTKRSSPKLENAHGGGYF